MAKRKKRKKASGYVAPAKGPELDAKLADSAEAQRDTLGDDGAAWGALQKELLGSTLPAADIAATIMRRDPKSLNKLIMRLRGHDVAPEPVIEADHTINPETLRDAMKAFRKRLKLTQLDHESRLGRSPLTTGKDAAFDSILPPHQYPAAVWETLTVMGELVTTGRGYYKLPKPPPAFRAGGGPP